MPERALVNVGNARDANRDQMKQIEAEGICPFCPEHLQRFHSPPIIHKGRHWVLTHNEHPYQGTNLHLLAIARNHIDTLCDLPPGAGEELFSMMQWAETHFLIEAGAVCLRFGDVMRGAATVAHLHCHLIVPEPGSIEPARFRISGRS